MASKKKRSSRSSRGPRASLPARLSPHQVHVLLERVEHDLRTLAQRPPDTRAGWEEQHRGTKLIVELAQHTFEKAREVLNRHPLF